MSTRLPDMTFDLSVSAGLDGIEHFDELGKELRTYVRSGGTLSKRFEKVKRSIVKRIASGDSLDDVLSDRTDVRAAISLWCQSRKFRRYAPVDSRALGRILELSPELKGSTLRLLIILYLEQFDRLGEGQKYLSQMIVDSLASLSNPRYLSSDLRVWRRNRAKLFAYDGPNSMAANASRRKLALGLLAKEWHIPDGPAARFYEMAKFIHYIKTLEKIPLNRPHQILQTISQVDVKESPYKEGLSLGHVAVALLIDRVISSRERISEEWSNFILSVMGDPRIPRKSTQFQKWWGRLEPNHVDAMIGWLSQWDLKLYLQILEEVAHSHGRESMLRMYPARKRFLEGLYDGGHIGRTRLLLGTDAVQFLQRTVDRKNWPEFAYLESAESSQSLIYLDLYGISIIEGTHNFAVRIYEDLPIPGLSDYEEKYFDINVIRGHESYVDRIVHRNTAKPTWQYRLISTLSKSFNIGIEPEEVLSEADYRVFRREYGMWLR